MSVTRTNEVDEGVSMRIGRSHVALPLGAYALLAVSPFVAHAHTRDAALFGVGAAALLLLFVGIHNAWDAVAYHVFVNLPRADAEPRRDETVEKEKR